jgi:TrmH family RNA methyltransferase
VLQGDRLVDDAIGAGVALELILVADDRVERARELARGGREVHLVESSLLGRVGSLKTSPGIVALAPEPAAFDLERTDAASLALVLVVAGVADPGNLGAIARAAEAFGCTALLVAQGGASPWNEKSLRGSMGSLLRVPVAAGVDPAAAAALLTRRGVRQVRAATRGGADPLRFDWRGPLALWIAGETGELPPAARAFEGVTIPIRGSVESLNVAVATAILLHAAGRGGAVGGTPR